METTNVMDEGATQEEEVVRETTIEWEPVT